MSRRTESKKMRTQREVIGKAQLMKGDEVVSEIPKYGKVTGYLPPAEVEIHHVMFRGISMEVKVQPGQRISMRREYARQKKAGLI